MRVITTTGFVQTLMTQTPTVRNYRCPYPEHEGLVLSSAAQLKEHATIEHPTDFEGLDQQQAHEKLRELCVKFERSGYSSAATAEDRSVPDIGGLTIDSGKSPRQDSPPSSGKRPPEHEFTSPRAKKSSRLDSSDPSYSGQIPNAVVLSQTSPIPQDVHDSVSEWSTESTASSCQKTPEPSSEWSAEATKSSQLQSQPQSPARSTQRSIPKPQQPQRQPGLIELQRYDPRYPGLLLQPDSRPISQEQLASEVKSIYAGLTMVETKCIHVDRAQAAAAQDSDTKLASDHWQALIALHRTLLHEHHDFFLASQHPSASPALRRLAAKYSMPARMWKHGIHSFLELLRRRLPDSIDYMLAFIYLAYQMMALLYETVPAFEDTWIECLGDLGRYRMAIEDEDVRDRETWAGVARSWYTKAVDKNPTVGRLYHHLAILARPNALQQMYYYSRSLTCVKPFQSTRESILTLLDPILGRPGATLTHALPIDTNFIKAHGLQFEKKDQSPSVEFRNAEAEFLGNLDNHIGRVTAKWKEQGVYIAVTNIAGWFEYWVEASLHEKTIQKEKKEYGVKKYLLSQAYTIRSSEAHDSFQTDTDKEPRKQEIKRAIALYLSQPNIEKETGKQAIKRAIALYLSQCRDENKTPELDIMILSELIGKENEDIGWAKKGTIPDAKHITNKTFALILRRINDKNVLPHIHVMLVFFSSLASSKHTAEPTSQLMSLLISQLIDDAPWAELVAFLNALVKTESQIQSQSQSETHNIDAVLASDVFPAGGKRSDELPLPEDYLVRGLIWAHDYFPREWFDREHDEEERYLEPPSTDKNRAYRVLRLAYRMANRNRWITYNMESHTFSVVIPERSLSAVA